MKFSPGDKVSFLNENQKGTVVRSFPGGKVVVEIEDGFEIEVFEKELIKTGSGSYEEKPIDVPTENKTIEQESDSLLKLCEKGAVCFAGVPAATGAVLTGTVNYYLINNSEYELVFTFFIKSKNKINGRARGVLKKQDEILLEGFRRDELINVESFILEGLIYYEDRRPAITHIRKEMAVMLPGITQTIEGIKGVAAFAKVVEVFNGHEPEPDSIKDLIEKIGTREKDAPRFKEKPTSKKHDHSKFGTFINEKEVDLHIEELQPDFSNLSNAEMIAIQMNHFAKEMDHAIRNHFKRIIFIHGVGNGVLKREIRNELRKYKGVTFRDGDFSKYGNGATEVNW